MGRHDDGAAVDVSRVRAEIDRYGWALQYVEAEDSEDAYGYTAGLTLRGLPEVVVRGLPAEDTWAVLNDLAEDCTNGRVPQPGEELAHVLRGATLTVRELADTTCLDAVHALTGDDGEVRAILLDATAAVA